MSGIKWAENEVKIACEKEHPGLKEGEWDYGCACYQSALKAYKSLAEDGHSGFSWGMTALPFVIPAQTIVSSCG